MMTRLALRQTYSAAKQVLAGQIRPQLLGLPQVGPFSIPNSIPPLNSTLAQPCKRRRDLRKMNDQNDQNDQDDQNSQSGQNNLDNQRNPTSEQSGFWLPWIFMVLG